ncbi:MAG: class I SAM-dependent methyltransferase, partial [Thiogranum sp.]
EGYPYPRRNPDDERRRLLATSLDSLGKISHFCFRGSRDLRQASRILVAGGGTGDAVIYLAEQLRGSDSELVYVDMSTASMGIAQQRAETRGLDNISWIHGSLLDLADMQVGRFDYINSSGVLHHLADPSAGLEALKSVLKPEGCLGLMVYAQYGRTGIYQMQELMRMVNADEPDVERQINNTRTILNALPDTNWFKRDAAAWLDEVARYGDVAIYDLFLHTQDRAYTVPELYEWLDNAGLNLLAWAGSPGSAIRYDPLSRIPDGRLRDQIGAMSVQRQEAIAELLDGGIRKHAVYASGQSDMTADITDLGNTPFFTFPMAVGEDAYRGLKGSNDRPFQLRSPNSSLTVSVAPDRFTKYILRYCDGRRSLAEIFDRVRMDPDLVSGNPPGDAILLQSFQGLYDAFCPVDMMFLRNKCVPPYKSFEELHTFSIGVAGG